MDKVFLRKLIDNKELQTTEFKRSFSGSEKASEIISGFANSDGGYFIIGVTDAGEIVGIKPEEFDSVQRSVAESAAAVKPSVVVSIEIVELEGKKLAVVTIPKISPGCHTFKGRMFARIGSTTRQLEGSAQLDFLRDKGTLMFDEIACSAALTDIDENKIMKYLRGRGQTDFLDSHSVPDFLLNSRLAVMNGNLKIKSSTILLFGKEPQQFIPQAEIRVVCFKGDEKGGDIISSKVIIGTLDQQIEDAISFVNKNTRQTFATESESFGKRIRLHEYPSDVIREAVVNSVAHRDYFSPDAIQVHIYDHRIEISNPGSLLKGISKDTLGKRSVLRNPTTYRILRDYEYMEGLGQGISKMCNLMRRAGLEDPQFDIDDFFFQVTLSSKNALKQTIETEGDLKPRQKAALEYLRKHDRLKREDYEKVTGVSYVTAIKDLGEMITFGFIEKIGKFRGTYYILKRR